MDLLSNMGGWLLRALMLVAAGATLAGEPVAEPEYHGSPLVRVWTAAETGGHAQSWGVHQGANGLIYVANNRGVLEFDGVSWRVISLPKGGYARTLTSDARGRIWVGSSDQICLLEPDATGSLQARSVTDHLRSAGGGALGAFFWSMPEADGRAVLFVGDNLVVRIGEDLKPEILSSGVTSRVAVWEGGAPLLRLGARPEPVNFAIVRNGQLMPAPELASLGVFHSVPDGVGGMMLFGLTEWSRWQDGHESARLPIPGLAANDTVRGVVALEGGKRFALATLRGGVLVVDRAGRMVERWSRADGLPDSTVRALALDRQGGLWLALNNGLARLQIDSGARVAPAGRGMDQTVTALAGEADGRFWVGGSQGILVREAGDSRFAARDDFPSDVFGFASVPGGGLLIAGRGLKTALAGRALPTEIDRPTTASGIPIFVAGGSIVALPEAQGVGLYTRREGGSWSPRTALRGVNGTIITVALADDGWLWLVREGREVMRARAVDAGILTATAESVGADAGADPKLLQRAKVVHWGGAIWLVGQGLRRWDPALGKFVEPPEVPAEWRSGDYQRPFALDDGSLWLERRLEDEDDQRLALLRLVWVDGRIHASAWNTPSLTRINPHALWLDRERQALWVGGYGGLGRLDLTASSNHETTAPGALLRRVTAAGKEIFGGRRKPSGEPTVLRPEQASMRFEFAAPWFPADQRGASPLRWRSRLLGFDSDWSAWSAETRRDYTNLPPGDYVFQTQARAWGEPGAVDAFLFTLPPPWWRSWWVQTLGGLVVLGSIVLITRDVSQRALKGRVLRLEAQAGIERERLRIARDMHDDLGSSLGRVALLSERGLEQIDDREAASETLRRIRETAQTLSTATRDIIWAVNPQNDTLAGTLDHLAVWVESALGEAGVRCFVDLPADIPLRQTGSQRRHALLLAIKEATQNLIKYAQATEAHFSAAFASNGTLTLTLRDNGRGFAPGEVRGTGHGTASIVARLASIGGTGRIESQPGQGTTVTLIVPS